MRRSSVRPTDLDCGLVCATASPPAEQLDASQAATAHARKCRQAGREATRGLRAARATSIIPPASDMSAPNGISEASGEYTLASGRRSTALTVAKGPSRPLLDICASGWGPQGEAACRPPEARGGAEGTAFVRPLRSDEAIWCLPRVVVERDSAVCEEPSAPSQRTQAIQPSSAFRTSGSPAPIMPTVTRIRWASCTVVLSSQKRSCAAWFRNSLTHEAAR